MSCKIAFAPSFKHSIKKLGKRYPHVKNDVKVAISVLQKTPRLGPVIPGGFSTRKLRVLNSDLRKGKRSGYRLIYYVEDQHVGDQIETTIYLLLLYSKSDKPDVTHQELKQLIQEVAQSTPEDPQL